MSHPGVIVDSRFDREVVIGGGGDQSKQSQQKTGIVQSKRVGGCALILDTMESHKPINVNQIKHVQNPVPVG